MIIITFLEYLILLLKHRLGIEKIFMYKKQILLKNLKVLTNNERKSKQQIKKAIIRKSMNTTQNIKEEYLFSK